MVLKEVAITLLSFSGLLFGYLLAHIAKEEIKPTRKYLIKLKRYIAIIASLALLYFSWSNITILLTYAVGIAISFIIKKEYFYIGLLMVLSLFIHNEALLFFSSMVFIYGCLYGILVEKQKWKTFYVNFWLFLLPFLLIWLEYLIGRNVQVFLGICIIVLSKYLIIRRPFRVVK